MIKHLQKKKKIILVPNQRYLDSRHLLQNPKVCRNVMGFSNRAQTFTPLNYLSWYSPFRLKAVMTRRHIFFWNAESFIRVFAGNVMTRQNKLAKHLLCLNIEEKTFNFEFSLEKLPSRASPLWTSTPHHYHHSTIPFFFFLANTRMTRPRGPSQWNEEEIWVW